VYHTTFVSLFIFIFPILVVVPFYWYLFIFLILLLFAMFISSSLTFASQQSLVPSTPNPLPATRVINISNED